MQNYEAEVRAREGRMALDKDLEGVFGVLRRADSSASTSVDPSAVPALKKLPSLAKTAGRAGSFVKTPSVSKLSKAPSAPKLVKAASAKKMAAGLSVAKKLVARATAATAGTPGPKAKLHRLSVPRKLNRERVPDTNFRFKELHWSPWKLAVVPASSADTPKGHWRRFLKGSARAKLGAVAGEAGHGKTVAGSVMCEAAVQTRPGGRRHVVWCRLVPATSARRMSFARLMASSSVRTQLQRVVRDGCRLWVRWAKVSRPGDEVEVRQVVKDVYDYAWCHGNAASQRDVWVPNGTPSHRVQIAGPVPMDLS